MLKAPGHQVPYPMCFSIPNHSLRSYYWVVRFWSQYENQTSGWPDYNPVHQCPYFQRLAGNDTFCGKYKLMAPYHWLIKRNCMHYLNLFSLCPSQLNGHVMQLKCCSILVEARSSLKITFYPILSYYKLDPSK